MTTSNIIHTGWYPEKELIITHISGDVDKTDIEQWEKSLDNALQQIEDNTSFKIFVNLHGFKATDLTAHKHFRDIIPRTLSQYGWKVGYVALFDEAKNMSLHTTRGIQCRGAVHVHQDATKIDEYQKRFGRQQEKFFTDPVQAEEWINNLP